MRANPDSIVFLAPTPWFLTSEGTSLGMQQLAEMYFDTWSETATISRPLDSEPFNLVLTVESKDKHTDRVEIMVEETIPDLEAAESLSYEPLAATERIRLAQHASIWRVVIRGGKSFHRGNAILAIKLMQSFCRCQTPAIFIPSILRLHPVGIIRTLSADRYAPDSITKLMITAWHNAEYMATRGLTALGLPELFSAVGTSHDDTFYLLMDLATEMMQNGEPFRDQAQLLLDTQRFRILNENDTLKDKEVPVSGAYGYQKIIAL